MKPKAYVGITGACDETEVDFLVKESYDVGYSMNSPHTPMLGFLASLKTLNGEFTKNRRYPQINKIPALLNKARTVFSMLHYNSREQSTLADQVSKLFENAYSSNLCRALQLNIVWPDVQQVKLIKDKFPDMRIVFQLSDNAMKEKSANEIIAGIEKYGGSLDYVLIDPSGGRGIEFDIDSSTAIYTSLASKFPGTTLGFAGGFTGNNVEERVQKLVKVTGSSDFCIDAEGGLRDKLSQDYGDDLLNANKAKNYLKSASTVLK